jgi:hypothetical protein
MKQCCFIHQSLKCGGIVGIIEPSRSVLDCNVQASGVVMFEVMFDVLQLEGAWLTRPRGSPEQSKDVQFFRSSLCTTYLDGKRTTPIICVGRY